MSALTFLAEAAATEAEHPLFVPAIVWAIMFAGGFVALGLITYSYKNVANRHREKWSSNTGHDAHH
ncbi:MAG: hypothetical protein RIR88_117 [Actinomycetota bacterium]|jgi:hypothetical protein